MATRTLIMAEASLRIDRDWNLLNATKHPPSEAENELSAATTCPLTPSGLDGDDDATIDGHQLHQLVPPVEWPHHDPKFIDCNEGVLLSMGDELDLAPPVGQDDHDGGDGDIDDNDDDVEEDDEVDDDGGSGESVLCSIGDKRDIGSAPLLVQQAGAYRACQASITLRVPPPSLLLIPGEVPSQIMRSGTEILVRAFMALLMSEDDPQDVHKDEDCASDTPDAPDR